MSAARRASTWIWIGATVAFTAVGYAFVKSRDKANVKHFQETSTMLPHEKDWKHQAEVKTLFGGGPTDLASLRKETNEKRRKIVEEYEKQQKEEYERKLGEKAENAQ